MTRLPIDATRSHPAAPVAPPARRQAWRPVLATAALGLALGAAAATELQLPTTVLIPDIGGFAMVSEVGPRWSSLTPAQREILGPLQDDWPSIDADRKQKWIELAAKFPKLSRAEQGRVRDRMVEWARLTPAQRGEARLNFQQATQTPAAQRHAQWEAYQALPAEEKSRLAHRAAENVRAQPSAGQRAAPTAKTNIVPNPVFTNAPRPVAPTVVRSGPGATTTLVNRPPTPPLHQMPGLPKVPASPTLVDPATLLPQRGPQAPAGAAAVVSSEGNGE